MCKPLARQIHSSSDASADKLSMRAVVHLNSTVKKSPSLKSMFFFHPVRAGGMLIGVRPSKCVRPNASCLRLLDFSIAHLAFGKPGMHHLDALEPKLCVKERLRFDNGPLGLHLNLGRILGLFI